MTAPSSNATAEFLASLPEKFGPLYADLCDWLEEQDVRVNASRCASPASPDAAYSASAWASPTAPGAPRLPLEVCERLQNLSAPVNGTLCLMHAPTLEHRDVVRGSFLALLAVLSFIGNCYTIHSIRNKASPAPVYKLILHLSLADVLVSIVCIMGEAVWMLLVEWTFGNVACKVFKFLQMTALHGSSYVVVLIAQNRWVAVNHPLSSRGSRRSGPCAFLCGSPRSVLFVWLAGAILSIPQLLVFSVKAGPFYEKFYQCVTYDAVDPQSERMYNIFYFITLFVIPLLVLIISYLSIYCALSKGQREIRSVDKISIATHDQNRQRSMKRAMVKSRWIAVVIVCAYLVFWLPYYITMLVFFLSPGTDEWYDSKWMDWIFFFGMGNSVVNPIIYGMFQLWKPKRRKQSSCFRHRDGSTQLTQFTAQDSFRRHLAPALALPERAVSPTGSGPTSAPASPLPLTLSAIPDVRRPHSPTPVPVSETTLMLTTPCSPRAASEVIRVEQTTPIIRTVALKTRPFSWRNKFLRKLRAHSAHQAHI